MNFIKHKTDKRHLFAPAPHNVLIIATIVFVGNRIDAYF